MYIQISDIEFHEDDFDKLCDAIESLKPGSKTVILNTSENLVNQRNAFCNFFDLSNKAEDEKLITCFKMILHEAKHGKLK